MIAIFILVIALLGIISTTVMVIKSNSFSKTMTTATTLAKDRMEDIEEHQIRQFDSGIGVGYGRFNSITRTWTVTNNTPAADMKTIQ